MKILVDADACPVKEEIIACAGKHHLPILLVADTAHPLFYNDPLVSVLTVDKGADSADFALLQRTAPGDICITQDYGLAALLLGKQAIVLHPNGFFYTSQNIEQMLFERHLSAEMRRQKRAKGASVHKRSKAQNEAFLAALENVLQSSAHSHPAI